MRTTRPSTSRSTRPTSDDRAPAAAPAARAPPARLRPRPAWAAAPASAGRRRTRTDCARIGERRRTGAAAVAQPRGGAVEIADVAQRRGAAAAVRAGARDRPAAAPAGVATDHPRQHGDPEKREEQAARAHDGFRVHQTALRRQRPADRLGVTSAAPTPAPRRAQRRDMASADAPTAARGRRREQCRGAPCGKLRRAPLRDSPVRRRLRCRRRSPSSPPATRRPGCPASPSSTWAACR